MKSFLNALLIAVMSFGFSVFMLDTVSQPTDIFYLVISLFLVGLAIVVHDNILTFLTIKKVFITRALTIGIVLSLGLYLMHWSFPGFEILEYTLNPKTIRFITIEQYPLGLYGTIALTAGYTGFMYSLLIWMKE